MLPHVLDSHDRDNDAPAVDALAAEFGADLEVVEPLRPRRRPTIIAGSTVLIGARMHACLNALSTGVPAIAMAYPQARTALRRDWMAVLVPPANAGDDGGAAAAARVLQMLADPSLDRLALETRARGGPHGSDAPRAGIALPSALIGHLVVSSQFGATTLRWSKPIPMGPLSRSRHVAGDRELAGALQPRVAVGGRDVPVDGLGLSLGPDLHLHRRRWPVLTVRTRTSRVSPLACTR